MSDKHKDVKIVCVRCMHTCTKNKFPLSSEWDKEAWRVRRNEKTLNFKKRRSAGGIGY